jgi:hypothetical protein
VCRDTFIQAPPPTYTQVYDPENNRWTVGANITTNRLYFGVAVVNDKLYAIGGVTYSLLGFVGPSAVNERYTPSGYGTQLQPELIYAATGVVAITIVAVTAVVLKKGASNVQIYSALQPLSKD